MYKVLDSTQFINEWDNLQAKRKANPEKYGLRSTGLKGLDRILGGGVDFGSVVIYAGKQKIGKSTVLQHTAKHMGLCNEPFLYVTLEMPSTSMATRLLCDMSGVEKDRIRRIEWSDSDWDRLQAQAEKVKKFQSWWTYGVSTTKGIKEVLGKIKHDYGIFVPILFVDYIQLMSEPGKGTGREEIEAISHSFKRMSVELDEPMLIFVAAQVNREAAKGNIVDANSFLGSGAIERDMDYAVIFSEIKDDSGEVRTDVRQATVVGARESGIGTVTIRFNGATSSVRDMEDTNREITSQYWQQQAKGVLDTDDL